MIKNFAASNVDREIFLKCGFWMRTCTAVRLYIQLPQTQVTVDISPRIITRILYILTVAALFLLTDNLLRDISYFYKYNSKNLAKRVMNILIISKGVSIKLSYRKYYYACGSLSTMDSEY